MKHIKYIFLFLLFSTGQVLFAQISDNLMTDLAGINIQKNEKGYDEVKGKTFDLTYTPGNPELPIYRMTYVLPLDAEFTEVKFTRKEKSN